MGRDAGRHRLGGLEESLVKRKPHSVLREIPRGIWTALTLQDDREGSDDLSVNRSGGHGIVGAGEGVRPRSRAPALK